MFSNPKKLISNALILFSIWGVDLVAHTHNVDALVRHNTRLVTQLIRNRRKGKKDLKISEQLVISRLY